MTKREKKLLIGSGILIFFIGIYYLIVAPIHENFEAAKAENQIVSQQIEALKQRMLENDEMDEIVDSYRKDVEKLEKALPSALHLEQIINIMYNSFSTNQIVINSSNYNMNDRKEELENADESMGIENLQDPMSIEEILKEYDDARIAGGPLQIANYVLGDIDYDNISYLSLTMNFTANYNNVKSVLKDIEDLDLTAVIKNIDIAKTVEEEDVEDDNQVIDYNSVVVNITIAIPFYHDNEEQKTYIFNYSKLNGNAYRKNGPFHYVPVKPKGSGDDEDKSVDKKTDEKKAYTVYPDFFITLNSVTSDLAGQSLGQYSYSSSNIALNSNNNQTFELNLKESNGKVSYQLVNAVDVFPSATEYFDFEVENDSIIVKVLSSTRSSVNDNASMTLKLRNNTTKKVIFYVYYDDSNRSRFTVDAIEGNYSIIQEQ